MGDDYKSMDGPIDTNSLKGIASMCTQKRIGRLRVVGADRDLVLIEKEMHSHETEQENAQKCDGYREFLLSQNERYRTESARKKGGADDRERYREKIIQTLSERRKAADTEKEMAVYGDEIDSPWINQCYYCDLLQ